MAISEDGDSQPTSRTDKMASLPRAALTRPIATQWLGRRIKMVSHKVLVPLNVPLSAADIGIHRGGVTESVQQRSFLERFYPPSKSSHYAFAEYRSLEIQSTSVIRGTLGFHVPSKSSLAADEFSKKCAIFETSASVKAAEPRSMHTYGTRHHRHMPDLELNALSLKSLSLNDPLRAEDLNCNPPKDNVNLTLARAGIHYTSDEDANLEPQSQSHTKNTDVTEARRRLKRPIWGTSNLVEGSFGLLDDDGGRDQQNSRPINTKQYCRHRTTTRSYRRTRKNRFTQSYVNQVDGKFVTITTDANDAVSEPLPPYESQDDLVARESHDISCRMHDGQQTRDSTEALAEDHSTTHESQGNLAVPIPDIEEYLKMEDPKQVWCRSHKADQSSDTEAATLKSYENGGFYKTASYQEDRGPNHVGPSPHLEQPVWTVWTWLQT
ncbi:hypothetical protein B0H16DRAFT_1450997 [Mycena metata]|uniref:Uncharacterized protein n=1 Tax=Mycena metata TaxID=1033252 RepID=A0AAD7NS11_9AGAR|nr:hypothetical protein B0H16DRAFT_1450997 [Mycena metata]